MDLRRETAIYEVPHGQACILPYTVTGPGMNVYSGWGWSEKVVGQYKCTGRVTSAINGLLIKCIFMVHMHTMGLVGRWERGRGSLSSRWPADASATTICQLMEKTYVNHVFCVIKVCLFSFIELSVLFTAHENVIMPWFMTVMDSFKAKLHDGLFLSGANWIVQPWKWPLLNAISSVVWLRRLLCPFQRGDDDVPRGYLSSRGSLPIKAFCH